MPAPCLTLLNSRLREVSCLVSICRSRRVRQVANFQAEQPALLRGALVLLSSHIEGFFEELIDDVVDAVDTGIQTPSAMPDAIRVRQVLGDPSRWSVSDQMQRWRLVRAAAQSPLFDDNAAHVPGQLDSGLHNDKFSNPGTSEIRDLFRTVGIPDCWIDFHAIEPRNTYKNEIDAIVSRRNQVAHGDMNAIITELDVHAYIKNFRHTATVFAQVAQNHIADHLPHFTW